MNLCIKICSTKRTLLHEKKERVTKKGNKTQAVRARSWRKRLLKAMPSLVHKNDVGHNSIDVGHNKHAKMTNGQEHLLWNCSNLYRVNMQGVQQAIVFKVPKWLSDLSYWIWEFIKITPTNFCAALMVHNSGGRMWWSYTRFQERNR